MKNDTINLSNSNKDTLESIFKITGKKPIFYEIDLRNKEKLEQIKVFGDDYPTKDGTGERDYIHVLDLIDGHIKALEYINSSPSGEVRGGLYQEINLGTGKPTSVLEMIKITEEVVGKKLNYKIVERRPGDIAMSYCSPDKAKKLLNWEAKYDIKEAIEDSWNFIKNKQK